MFFSKLIIMLLGLKNSMMKQSFAPPIKKVISISPGGYRGFYLFGVCKYIKEHYDLTDYIFSGASAGSFTGLAFCYKKSITEFQNKVIDDSVVNTKSIKELENLVKHKILSQFTKDDFELDKLFVGVTTIQNFKPKTVIHSDFMDLDDAVSACIASSHIPYITGGFSNVYRDKYSFDGGFSKYPYLDTSKSILNITPEIWNNDQSKPAKFFRGIDYTSLFSRNKFDFNDMIEKGYKDSEENRYYLDNIFIQKDDS